MSAGSMETYLRSTYFLDLDSKTVRELAQSLTSTERTETDNAVSLFYWVRDKIHYDVYNTSFDPADFKASAIIKKKTGWCVPKAVVLTALARAAGIPSRLHFADIQNFQITDKLREMMKTDIFYYHGYTEIYLNKKWMKATPAFNIELCEKMGHKTVEFDGVSHGMLPARTHDGEKHIEYLNDRGVSADLPIDEMVLFFQEKYPFV